MAEQVNCKVMAMPLNLKLGAFTVKAEWGEILYIRGRWRRQIAPNPKQFKWKPEAPPVSGHWET